MTFFKQIVETPKTLADFLAEEFEAEHNGIGHSENPDDWEGWLNSEAEPAVFNET